MPIVLGNSNKNDAVARLVFDANHLVLYFRKMLCRTDSISDPLIKSLKKTLKNSDPHLILGDSDPEHKHLHKEEPSKQHIHLVFKNLKTIEHEDTIKNILKAINKTQNQPLSLSVSTYISLQRYFSGKISQLLGLKSGCEIYLISDTKAMYNLAKAATQSPMPDSTSSNLICRLVGGPLSLPEVKDIPCANLPMQHLPIKEVLAADARKATDYGGTAIFGIGFLASLLCYRHCLKSRPAHLPENTGPRLSLKKRDR